jgi:hypothetical protein
MIEFQNFVGAVTGKVKGKLDEISKEAGDYIDDKVTNIDKAICDSISKFEQLISPAKPSEVKPRITEMDNDYVVIDDDCDEKPDNGFGMIGVIPIIRADVRRDSHYSDDEKQIDHSDLDGEYEHPSGNQDVEPSKITGRITEADLEDNSPVHPNRDQNHSKVSPSKVLPPDPEIAVS